MSGAERAVRLDAARTLADSVCVAVSSRVSAGLVETVRSFEGISGVIATGPLASRTCRTLSLAAPELRCGVDVAAYEKFQASASAPMSLPRQDGFWAWTLGDLVDSATALGAKFVFSPSGVIGLGDTEALSAVIKAGNAVKRPGLVTTLAVPREWLTEMPRAYLQVEVARSNKPVALVVIGRFDPYEDREVADGLLELLEACPGQVFLHRTDTTAIPVLVRDGLGASIGNTSSLRHTVPSGYKPQNRRKRKEPALPIFVPGINEFRDIAEIELWFGNDAPKCSLPNCCGRRLNDFSHDSWHDGILACHNARGWLNVTSELISHGPRDRKAWFRRYRDNVRTAYDELRSQTGVRAIRPSGSAQVWLEIDI